MGSYKTPPSWALRLLQRICLSDLIEEVEGDLYEAFQWRIEKKGITYSRRHYIIEVLRNLRYLKVKLPFTQNTGFMLLKNYFKTGFRFLWKTKGYSSINILGLALGIAICWLSYVFVTDEYSYDRFYENADQIYRITADIKMGDHTDAFAGSSYIMGEEFTKSVPGINRSSRFKSGYALLNIGQETFGQSTRYADPAFFDMFSVSFIQGGHGDFNSPNVTVIDESTALRLGITTLDGSQTVDLTFGDETIGFKVLGIFKDFPINSSLRPKIILPFAFWKTIVPESKLTGWFDINMNTFFQIEKNAPPEIIAAGMTKFLGAAEDFGEMEVALGLQNLKDIHTDKVLNTGNGIGGRADKKLMDTVTIIGILCLIIASLNYSNFAISNYLTRLKEVAVRKVFGAEKKYVFQQFVSETFISVFIALICSLGFMALLMPMFSQYANKNYEMATIFNLQFLQGGLGLLIIVTMLAGCYPAFIISRYTILASLSNRQSKGSRGIFSKGLIVVQFAMTVFLITGLLTIDKQLNFMIDFDPGFNDENIVLLEYPLDEITEVNKFKNDLKSFPNVQAASFSSSYNGTGLALEENKSVDVRHARVDVDFLSLMGIKVVAGRDFDESVISDFTRTIIINQALADKLDMENPIGERIPFDYGGVKDPIIIGVVPNYNYESLHSEIDPMLMYLHNEYEMQRHYIKITNYSPEVIDQIEVAWNKHFAPNPFEFSMFEDVNDAQYELEGSIRDMAQSGAIIAIMLSCLGLMGVVGMQVRRRLKEVSVRKVVSAAPKQIFTLFSMKFIGLVALGFIIGLVLTFSFVNSWLDEYTTRIEFSWDIGVLAMLITFSVAAITIFTQLYRVIHLNPVTYLKEE